MRVGHCAGCWTPRGESVEDPSSSGRRQWFRLVLRSIHDDIPADSACSRWARDPREHTRWGFWISRMPMAPAYFGRRELGPFGIRAHKALSPSALKRTSMQRSARKPGGVLAPTCSVPRALVQLVTPYQRLWQERSATTLRIDTNAGKEGGHAPVVVACSILSQLISQRQDEMYRTAKDLRSSMVSRVPSAH